MNSEVKQLTITGVSKKNNSFIADEVWYNVSNFAKNADGTKMSVDVFEKGQTYTFLVNKGPKGGNYVNGIVETNNGVSKSDGPVSSNTAPTPSDSRPTAPAAPQKQSTAMSKEEWQSKDRRISKQGFLQNALVVCSSAGYAVNADELKDKALDLAQWGFKQVSGEDW